MWIPSKLTRPGRLHNTITRARVLDLLKNALDYKLILFRSPAGYGKTTMVAQWLANKPHTGWYNLDDSDNDTFHFANYFIQALNKATNNACPNAQTLAEKRQFSNLLNLFSQVFGELQQFSGKSYIVLDDYHLIHNEEIHAALRFYIKHQPENITLIMTSRTVPPIGSANLRVRGTMLEIDHQRLAFDNEETLRFFNQRFTDDIDHQTADNLCQYVEGWPSALQLIALQAQHHNKTLAQSAHNVAQFNHAHLWEYLVEEVFDLLDKETCDFLLQCSVLEHFNDTLISALTQRDDALAMIESLNRYGLFIHPLEGEHNWYRFHHLFAEFLTHERQSRIPKQEQILHESAARAWLDQSSPHQALRHAQKASNQALIADILIEHGWNMFNNGELTNLEKAIEQLADEILYREPKLCMLKAWLAQSQHRYHEVGELLHTTNAQMSKHNIALSTQQKGEFNALRAQVAINHNEPQQAFELAELALSQLESHVYRSRIIATSVIGEVNHVLGHLNQALSMMQQTEKLARQHHLYHQALWAMLQQSEILVAQGHTQHAFNVQENAFRLIEEQQLQQLPLHEFLLRTRAHLLWSLNRLDEAKACAYQGIEVLGHHETSQHLLCYAMLARVAIGQEQWKQAEEFVEHIKSLLNQANYHVDWSANASFSLILYWQAQQDFPAIKQWLATANYPQDACNHFNQLQWRNIALAQINLKLFDEAAETMAFLQLQANKSELIADTQRNLIVEALLSVAQNQVESAHQHLSCAIELANHAGMIGSFFVNNARLTTIIVQLNERSSLSEQAQYQTAQLFKTISQFECSQAAPFNQSFVAQLLIAPNTPTFVHTSPLTQREWQVFGLIHSGLSNERIAQELDVAGTTVKTHIRNLYQKLGIANRKQAIETAEKLLNI